MLISNTFFAVHFNKYTRILRFLGTILNSALLGSDHARSVVICYEISRFARASHAHSQRYIHLKYMLCKH
jgi:hypothetical protein